MIKSAIFLSDGSKNCFCKLSRDLHLTADSLRESVVEVSNGSHSLYTTVSGDQCQGQNTININGLFAEKQCIKNNNEVMLTIVKNVPKCLRVFIEPLSVDDWEILEMHTGYIENNLLNQVLVVWPGQVFPVWVQKSICIFVKTGDTEPISPCVLLEERTEVIITPKDRRRGSATAQKSVKATANKSTANPKIVKKTRFADKVEYEHFTNDHQEESLGIVELLWERWISWLSGDSDADVTSAKAVPVQSPYLECTWQAGFRVQQMGVFRASMAAASNHDSSCADNNIELSDIQPPPTNVFINRRTFHKFCISTSSCDTSSFLASLTFLLSPSQKEDRMKKAMEKSTTKQPASSTTDALNNVTSGCDECDSDADVGDANSVTVRVTVLDETGLGDIHHRDDECPLRLTGTYGVLDGHVMISDQLRRQLAIDVTGRVVLTSLSPHMTSAHFRSVSLHPLFQTPIEFTPEMLIAAFRTWLLHCSPNEQPLVATDGTLVTTRLKPDLDGEFLLSFQTSSTAVTSQQQQQRATSQYYLLSPVLANELDVSVEQQLNTKAKPPWLRHLPCLSTRQIDVELPDVTELQLGGISDLMSTAVQHAEISLCCRPLAAWCAGDLATGLRNGALLISGCRGVGRTSFAKALSHCLAQPPNYAFCTMLECKQLRGKRVESIQKTLERVFAEAAWRQPSVIVLDDLDLICGSPSGPEEEMSPDVIYYGKIAQIIRDLLKFEMREQSLISLIVTSQSAQSLHQTLSEPQGLRLFQHVIELKPPNKTQRVEVLRKLMQRHVQVDSDCDGDGGVDMTQVVAKTEGFVAKDLELVLHRAVHSHFIFNPVDALSERVTLNTADFVTALEGFTPASLQNVNLHRPSDVSWADVGGLHDVRHRLVETLLWPSKYPELFANCPLRLRSGLLLYGAPGTGKTLLASVVAKECQLNFISIKGPELLSKYIGASEQAVRDTFLRAQSAKPCILFFDEFDSLAPRRGHDSTGVTDRVVNQMLTQLDGVEGLDGVYVLAATSRPDLIDPALLRPGRLDKALHCGLPDANDRLEILTSLTRHMSLSDDVKLAELANGCQYFSGADFKALLYNAQLNAIHEQYGVDFGGLSGSVHSSNDDGGDVNASSPQKVVENIVNDADVTTTATNRSDSETSATSSSSWEAVSTPAANELHREFSLLESPASLSAQTSLTYIASLEDGVSEMSDELEQTIRQQVSQLYSSVTSADDDSLPAVNKSATARSKTVVIHQRHLVSAADSMTPSVSASERHKFNAIYEQFVASRGSNFNELSSFKAKRATLA